MGFFFVSARILQAPPATSSVAPAQIQPLRGVSPGGGPRSVEYRPLKGVFTPTAASYDGRSRTAVRMGGHRERMVEGSPLAASCTDGVDGKQVAVFSDLLMLVYLYRTDIGVFVA